jgi:hypothetical protein
MYTCLHMYTVYINMNILMPLFVNKEIYEYLYMLSYKYILSGPLKVPRDLITYVF